MNNYFEEYNWSKILSMYPETKWDTKEYHKILSPDFPDFLNDFINLPIMKRLEGIGLLCGTDWTPLYKNRFYYSRLDHSIGVALIIWNFTKNKAQTIAGLLHDISTPVFSHVSDFRKGDALTQTITELSTSAIISQDKELQKALLKNGLSINQVDNYHIYPIADNEIPNLSADRLEYMFPSGAALEGSWSLPEIAETYSDIAVFFTQRGQANLGFKNVPIALNYCKKFCMTGHVLQLNENKLTLQLLGKIMNLAEEKGILCEEDFMKLSEKQIIEKLELVTMGTGKDEIPSNSLYFLLKTFRNMTQIEHTQSCLSPLTHFSVSLPVKQRYINPLVKYKGQIHHLSEVSSEAKRIIQDFLNYKDTEYGCVKLWK